MRSCIFLLLLSTVLISCSKKEKAEQRSNFAEVTVNGNTFKFTTLEAIIDTSHDGNTCNVAVRDTVSNSSMVFETLVGFTKRTEGNYQYPGELFPGPSLVYLHMQTYVNSYPATYTVQNDAFKLVIDEVAKGRMHGTLSGKINCYTCTPYFMLADINGEFEMPVTYR